MEPPVGPSPPSYRPDWYPDPTRRFEFRYHNGQAWTGDVSVNGNRFLDPLPTTPFAPAMSNPGFSGLPFERPESIAKAMAAFVLGLCSILLGWVPFLCVLAGAGAIVGLVLGIGALRRDSMLRRDGGQNHRGHGYALAGVILAPIGLVVTGLGIWFSVVTWREVKEFTDVGAYRAQIVECSVSGGLATARGTITNETGTTRSYHLTVRFDRPGTNTQLESDSTTINDVGAGDTNEWTVSGFVSDGAPGLEKVDCFVDEVTGPVPFGQS